MFESKVEFEFLFEFQYEFEFKFELQFGFQLATEWVSVYVWASVSSLSFSCSMSSSSRLSLCEWLNEFQLTFDFTFEFQFQFEFNLSLFLILNSVHWTQEASWYFYCSQNLQVDQQILAMRLAVLRCSCGGVAIIPHGPISLTFCHVPLCAFLWKKIYANSPLELSVPRQFTIPCPVSAGILAIIWLDRQNRLTTRKLSWSRRIEFPQFSRFYQFELWGLRNFFPIDTVLKIILSLSGDEDNPSTW